MKITNKSGVWMVWLLALIVLWGERLVRAQPAVSIIEDTASKTLGTVDGMVTIAAGVYTPLYTTGKGEGGLAIKAFYLDTYAVTNAQYLSFVQANAQWHRARVPRLFADPAYLSHWPSDLPPPEAAVAWLHSPVTYVSWFAARAYCAWQQKRLPRVAEWEYAALASDRDPDGRHDPAYMLRLLEWYTRPALPLPPPVGSGGQNYWGVYDLHGVIWEWVADFQSALVTGESRGDGDLERNCGAGMAGTAPQERVNYPAFMRYAYRSSLRGTYGERRDGHVYVLPSPAGALGLLRWLNPGRRRHLAGGPQPGLDVSRLARTACWGAYALGRVHGSGDVCHVVVGGLVNASYSLNLVVHNTAYIVGHFHLTVGTAVTLSFMGITYWLVPVLRGRRLWSRSLALVQSWLWFVGMSLFSFALHDLGMLGMPRRTMISAAPYIQPAWQPLRPLVGIGGTLLFVSAMLYFLNLVLTCVASRAPAPEMPAFAEALSGPEEAPAMLDRWRPWLVLTALFLVLAYAHPLMHLVRNAPFNVPGLRVW